MPKPEKGTDPMFDNLRRKSIQDIIRRFGVQESMAIQVFDSMLEHIEKKVIYGDSDLPQNPKGFLEQDGGK